MGNKNFFKQKTTWAAITGIITTAGAYAMGEIELVPALQAAVGFVGMLCIRHKMVKE